MLIRLSRELTREKPLGKSSANTVVGENGLALHGTTHCIGVHRRVGGERVQRGLLQEGSVHSLSLRDRAVLVREQERFQVDNLLTKLRYLGAQVLVLGAVEFYLVLKARQPGLLALSTFKGSHPVT